ncbi:hypothetical protein [Nonomuraea recticatena]|uniref:hypothetical protein n=1 Tax=Nonomuraea recticatena TaxID=46178 RepID=UPI00360DEF74
MEYSRAVIAFITMMSIIGNPGYTTYLPVVWTLLNTLNKLVLLNFVAGLAHDIVQGHGRGFDERLAAAIVALITKLFMPDTYRELEKHRVHPGHYTYDSVIATTFIQHEMRQAITPGVLIVSANTPPLLEIFSLLRAPRPLRRPVYALESRTSQWKGIQTMQTSPK